MTPTRLWKALRLPLTLGAAAAVWAAPASAEPEFDVSIDGGKVVVVAKGDWHINTKYPWKIVMGSEKVGTSAFTLTEKKATVTAPKGKGTLKGGVCSGAQCKMFKKAVDIH